MEKFSRYQRYYAKWVDMPSYKLDIAGLHLSPTREREVAQRGYHEAFPVLALLVSTGAACLSYAPRLRELDTFKCAPAELGAELSKRYPGKVRHALKFRFTQLKDGIAIKQAFRMEPDDYEEYLAFFKEQYPNKTDTDWLEEHYKESAGKGLFFGVRSEGTLASVASAPDIPYMADELFEPGIDTLLRFRGHGLATIAAAAQIERLTKKSGLTPVWSCSTDNEESRWLAERLGFVQYADCYYITASDL